MLNSTVQQTSCHLHCILQVIACHTCCVVQAGWLRDCDYCGMLLLWWALLQLWWYLAWMPLGPQDWGRQWCSADGGLSLIGCLGSQVYGIGISCHIGAEPSSWCCPGLGECTHTALDLRGSISTIMTSNHKFSNHVNFQLFCIKIYCKGKKFVIDCMFVCLGLWQSNWSNVSVSLHVDWICLLIIVICDGWKMLGATIGHNQAWSLIFVWWQNGRIMMLCGRLHWYWWWVLKTRKGEQQKFVWLNCCLRHKWGSAFTSKTIR